MCVTDAACKNKQCFDTFVKSIIRMSWYLLSICLIWYCWLLHVFYKVLLQDDPLVKQSKKQYVLNKGVDLQRRLRNWKNKFENTPAKNMRAALGNAMNLADMKKAWNSSKERLRDCQ